MGKTMYLECSTGISGDMFVAALLDLGADQKVLDTALESLHTKGARIRISRVNKAGLEKVTTELQSQVDEFLASKA